MKHLLISIAALAVMSPAALAAAPRGVVGPNGASVSADGQYVTTPHGSYAPSAPRAPHNGALVKIFDNLAEKYPDGLYWATGAWNVSGPDSQIGQTWLGAAFTPANDAKIAKIVVAAEHISGTNALVLSLRSDDGGVPGAILQKWSIADLHLAGTCCAVTAKSSAGIPVTGGHQYWVVLSANATSHDTFAGWNSNVTEQIQPLQLATNHGTGWSVQGATPGPAFAVFASP